MRTPVTVDLQPSTVVAQVNPKPAPRSPRYAPPAQLADTPTGKALAALGEYLRMAEREHLASCLARANERQAAKLRANGFEAEARAYQHAAQRDRAAANAYRKASKQARKNRGE